MHHISKAGTTLPWHMNHANFMKMEIGSLSHFITKAIQSSLKIKVQLLFANELFVPGCVTLGY